jgi:hypothetical protein
VYAGNDSACFGWHKKLKRGKFLKNSFPDTFVEAKVGKTSRLFGHKGRGYL